jgi:hypothetical protein
MALVDDVADLVRFCRVWFISALAHAHLHSDWRLLRIVGGELESIGANSLQALWMRSRKASGLANYTVQQINYFPSGATAVAIAALLITVRLFPLSLPCSLFSLPLFPSFFSFVAVKPRLTSPFPPQAVWTDYTGKRYQVSPLPGKILRKRL